MKPFLLTCLFSGFYLVSFSQVITEAYRCPIRPGTQDWDQLGGTLERVRACQIPSEVLSRLETLALLESCLDFPFFSDVLLYDDLQTGFNKVKTCFNGLPELLKRDDLGVKMLPYYKKIIFVNSGKDKKKELRKNLYRILFLELILSQDEVLEGLSEDDKNEARVICVAQFEQKQSNPDIFSSFSLSTSALILAKIIQNNETFLSSKYSNKDFDMFYKKVNYPSDQFLYDIYKANKNL